MKSRRRRIALPCEPMDQAGGRGSTGDRRPGADRGSPARRPRGALGSPLAHFGAGSGAPCTPIDIRGHSRRCAHRLIHLDDALDTFGPEILLLGTTTIAPRLCGAPALPSCRWRAHSLLQTQCISNDPTGQEGQPQRRDYEALEGTVRAARHDSKNVMRAVRGEDQKGRSLSRSASLGEPGKKVDILPADLPDAAEANMIVDER